MLRRLVLVGSLVVAGLAVAGQPAGAAPANSKNSQLIQADCGNARPVEVLVNGGAPAFDANAPAGRAYTLVSIQGRSYEGSFTTEPPPPPDFVFQHAYGNRHGFTGSTLECTASVQEVFDGTTFTTFFNFVVTTK